MVVGMVSLWQGQLFALVWVVFSLPMVIHLMTHPALLRRRLRGGPLGERQPVQKLIISLFSVCLVAEALLTVLDRRREWSTVPTPVVLFGDLLVAAGLLLIWQVFRANQFAAASVTVESGQTVISSGPYALVRHPMYGALTLIVFGIPIALGSWWGLAVSPVVLTVIILRLMNEEQFLASSLPGYRDYCAKVTHRLIPGVW